MNMIQARKAARGLSAAADYLRGQLFICRGLAHDEDNLDVPGFSLEPLDKALFTVINRCGEFLQCCEPQVGRDLLGEISSARRCLALALLDKWDDGETMRYTQLSFLAESLRVVQERYTEALLAGAIRPR